jgi:hypothetical protein
VHPPTAPVTQTRSADSARPITGNADLWDDPPRDDLAGSSTEGMGQRPSRANGKGETVSDGVEFLWGIVLIACGVFICVYGNLLFRFVLAVIGFAVGFAAGFALTDGQSDGLRVLVALVAGAAAALLLFSLIRVGLYIAGGILGAVLGMVIASLFGLLDDGFDWSSLILIVAGAGGCGFFGHRLGNWIITLATTAAGAFLCIYGLSVLYVDEFATDVEDPGSTIAASLPLVIFLVIAAIAGLGQYVSSNLRFRLRN